MRLVARSVAGGLSPNLSILIIGIAGSWRAESTAEYLALLSWFLVSDETVETRVRGAKSPKFSIH